jgi:hypothetical protein
MYSQTEIQIQVTESLERARFRVNHVSNCGEETATVFMSRRHPKSKHSTQYAEVDSAGLVNGLELNAFLSTLN